MVPVFQCTIWILTVLLVWFSNASVFQCSDFGSPLYLNSYQVNKLRQFSGNESFIFGVASREVCHLAHDRVDAGSSDDCPGRSSNHEGRVEGHVPGAQLIFVSSVYVQLEGFGFTCNNLAQADHSK